MEDVEQLHGCGLSRQDFALVRQFGVPADRVSCFNAIRRRFGVKPSHSITVTSPVANECPVMASQPPEEP